MTSLPPLSPPTPSGQSHPLSFKADNHSHNNVSVKDSSSGDGFCDDCSQVLLLPVRKIDVKIRENYKEECKRIRKMEQILMSKENRSDSEDINISEFPLIRNVQPAPQLKSLNWKALSEKYTEKSTRCQLTSPEMANKIGKNKIVRKLPCLPESSRVDRHTPVTIDKPNILKIDPEHVVFMDVEIGSISKKYCKITNISAHLCKVAVKPPKDDSPFRMVWNCDAVSLAPGMSMQLIVKFHCQALANVRDTVMFVVRDEPPIMLTLEAQFHPPHLIGIDNADWNSTEDMISTIDCGFHFVGTRKDIQINIQNIGSAARFCFVREADWLKMEFNEFDSLPLNITSMFGSGPFQIEPMYFSLKKDEVLMISVVSITQYSGLHLERVMLLCDNGAVKTVDLVAHGYLFEPSWIQILELSKLFDIDINDDEDADCYLNFGISLTSDRSYFCFDIFNSGYVNMSYHWEVHPAAIAGASPLPGHALTIQPPAGRLYAHSGQIVCVRCDSGMAPGSYRSLLKLVIDDLPTKCIPLECREKLIRSGDDEEGELNSVVVQNVEVWIQIVEPTILLAPSIVDFSHLPLVCGSVGEDRVVVVHNSSPGPLTLTWLSDRPCDLAHVCISPKQFQCAPFSSTSCIVHADPLSPGTFDTNFWCVTETGDYGVELLVKGECAQGELTLVVDSVDWGLVKKGDLHIADVVAKNATKFNSSHWSVDELLFDSTDDGLLVPADLSSLSATQGYFCHINSEVLVSHQLYTQEDTLWCSVVRWGSGQFLPITANVQQTDVSLSTHHVVASPLYRGVQYDVTLTVYNHTLLPTAVFWGHPIADPDCTVVVNVTPRYVILKPTEQMRTNVHLTPYTVGSLRNLFLPCFVEGSDRPLLLMVEGTVEDLRVRVEWTSATRHCCLVWPPTEEENQKSVRLSVSLDSILCPCPPNSEDSGSEHSEFVTITLLEDSPFGEECVSKSDTNLSQIKSDGRLSVVQEEQTKSRTDAVVESLTKKGNDTLSNVSSIPYLNWPLVGGKYTRQPMSQEMERRFQNLFTLEELMQDYKSKDNRSGEKPTEDFAIHFDNIPIREAVTQKVYIRNDTTITSSYKACIATNFERPQPVDTALISERLKLKMKWRHKQDEWYDRCCKDRGLTVFVEPASGKLWPEDYVCVLVTVYALSWGHYTDTLLLHLGDLDVLGLRITVTVRQHPVCVNKLIRFGAFSHKTEESSRGVKVSNSSSVPVYIVWQLYSPLAQPEPVSVVLLDSSPFKLQLTSSFGSYGSQHFELVERYLFIPPHSTAELKVKFYPNRSHLVPSCGILSDSPQATLIGHVYLTDEARTLCRVENCVRADGGDLEPLEVRLEAYVELPILTLLNVFNDQLQFKCRAYDVMCTEDRVWREQSVLTVKNNCSTEINANVATVGVFHVSKIRYPCENKGDPHSNKCLSLAPGEICQIFLVCEVNQETLYDCFELDPEILLQHPVIETGIIVPGVLLFKNEDFDQDVKLELQLIQPCLLLSVSQLNFGLTYVGDSKTLLVTLTAPLGKEYFEAFVKCDEKDIFSTSVERGIVGQCAFILQVTFSPKESGTFKGTLVIQSCMDRLFSEIQLNGIGTYDYKFHAY